MRTMHVPLLGILRFPLKIIRFHFMYDCHLQEAPEYFIDIN